MLLTKQIRYVDEFRSTVAVPIPTVSTAMLTLVKIEKIAKLIDLLRDGHKSNAAGTQGFLSRGRERHRGKVHGTVWHPRPLA